MQYVESLKVLQNAKAQSIGLTNDLKVPLIRYEIIKKVRVFLDDNHKFKNGFADDFTGYCKISPLSVSGGGERM